MPAKELMFLIKQKRKRRENIQQTNVLICNMQKPNDNNNKKFNKAVPNKKQTTNKNQTELSIYLFRDFLRFLIQNEIQTKPRRN